VLTEQQLAATALRIIDGELDRLASYDRTEQIDKMLCADCPPMDCSRDPVDAGREIRAVHQQLTDAIAVLRLDLARYAAARNVTIPAA
jgi:hypothetical protein